MAKRSEVVEAIKRVWVDSTSWPTDQIVAEAIMKEVEKYMVPEDRSHCHCDDCGGGPDHSFDPEDET